MKTTFLQKISLSAMIVAAPALLFFGASAQDIKKDKKTSIRVRVSEDDHGRVKDIDKQYEVGDLSDKEREEFVGKVLDSLGVDKKKKQSVSITFDDADRDVRQEKREKVIIDHRDEREPFALHRDWTDDFRDEWDSSSEKFRYHFKNLERDLGPRAKVFAKDMEDFGNRMGSMWEKGVTKPASVRGLNAYTNNPNNGVLNVRFDVPVKGDVVVTVTDTKGREVGKKEVKDFEGEFVGQVELKKNIKGTVFVTVVQNEDGTVKRVVIP